MKKMLIVCSVIFFSLVSIDYNAKGPTPTTFQDKTIIYFGDSIMAGSENSKISWDYYMNLLEPFKNYTNAGRQAATFSTIRSDNMIVSQVLTHKNTTYDYVLIQGGINDAMDEAPLGKMTESYDIKSFDKNTFIGSVDTTLYYLTKYYNKSSIGMIITYRTPDALSHGWKGKTSNAKEYFDALKAVCKKWRIPTIDFFEGTLSTIVGEAELIDGLHLNHQGYKKTSPYLINFIKLNHIYNRNLAREKRIKESGLIYYSVL